jgi:uncharacterized phage protein (TIGR02218 family)
MKIASSALITLMQSQEFILADLYTFTLTNGAVLRYTNADGALTVSGNVFNTLTIGRGNLIQKIGTEVVMLNASTMYGSITLAQFFRQGGLDGATLQLERLFMPSNAWGDTSRGTLIMFTGRVADINIFRDHAVITVNSGLELLNIMLPRNTYQAGCVHTLYDGGCGLIKANFGTSANTTANSTSTVINCNLTNNSGTFTGGTILWTSGNNNGVSMTVQSYVVGQITLNAPLANTPSTGDHFTAYLGCDKTQTTCTNTFNNVANFRAYPFIPSPETPI